MNVDDATPARPVSPDIGAIVEQLVTFTTDDLEDFARLSGDRASLHFDPTFAKDLGFPGVIVHGLLVGARFSRLMGMYLPGERSIIQSLTLQYRRPIVTDIEVRFRVEVEKVVESVGAIILRLSASVGDTVAAEGRAQCVLCEPRVPTSIP